MTLTDEQIDRFLNDLARPMFNWRMASAMLALSERQDRSDITDRAVRGAQTRLTRARAEIHALLVNLDRDASLVERVDNG